mmetsp:Transcript_80699/g.94120  ORF Transcript_80699/g.94120 Transcript_80699/m.94120 type:complete len:249 (+) Transcript_80699:14-760(+)
MLSKVFFKRFGALSSKGFDAYKRLSHTSAVNFSSDPKQGPRPNPEEEDNKPSQFEDVESHFYKKGNPDIQGVQINVENIRKKQKEFNRETKLSPLEKYKIPEQKTYYNPKDNPNPTRDVFEFSEDVLLKKEYMIQVFGLGNGYFSVNGVWYPGSILVFPRQIFLWDVPTAVDIRPHSLDIIDYIKPQPNYVIIGTGKEKVPLVTSIYERFSKKGIKVDVLPTFEACSTFNVCNEDMMNVCAFLIPANL